MSFFERVGNDLKELWGVESKDPELENVSEDDLVAEAFSQDEAKMEAPTSDTIHGIGNQANISATAQTPIYGQIEEQDKFEDFTEDETSSFILPEEEVKLSAKAEPATKIVAVAPEKTEEPKASKKIAAFVPKFDFKFDKTSVSVAKSEASTSAQTAFEPKMTAFGGRSEVKTTASTSSSMPVYNGKIFNVTDEADEITINTEPEKKTTTRSTVGFSTVAAFSNSTSGSTGFSTAGKGSSRSFNGEKATIQVLKPERVEEVGEACKLLKEGNIVIVYLSGITETQMKYRYLDYLSGCCKGCDANFKEIIKADSEDCLLVAAPKGVGLNFVAPQPKAPETAEVEATKETKETKKSSNGKESPFDIF